jgi:Spy/CpxP family protein refolding chaperone
MINRTHVWFAVFVVILFAAGVASGVALDRGMGWGLHRGGGFRSGPGGPGGPGGRGMGSGGRGNGQGGPATETFVNELDQALTLTADQKTKISAIIDASRPRLRALQEDASNKFTDEQQAVTQEISKVLTPDQAKKLEELQKKPRGGPFGFRSRGGRGH